MPHKPLSEEARRVLSLEQDVRELVKAISKTCVELEPSDPVLWVALLNLTAQVAIATGATAVAPERLAQFIQELKHPGH